MIKVNSANCALQEFIKILGTRGGQVCGEAYNLTRQTMH